MNEILGSSAVPVMGKYDKSTLQEALRVALNRFRRKQRAKAAMESFARDRTAQALSAS